MKECYTIIAIDLTVFISEILYSALKTVHFVCIICVSRVRYT
jgi:hypothetical protein